MEAMAEMDEVPSLEIDVANLAIHILACVAWYFYQDELCERLRLSPEALAWNLV